MINNEEVIAVATVALVVVTLFLVLVTRRLWSATRDLVIGADRNAQLQLRPYLHVSSARGVIKDGKFVATVVIQNYGQTPAYDVVQWIGITASADFLDPTLGEPEDGMRRAKTIIGPGNNTSMEIPLLDSICHGREAMLRESKAAIYVFGSVSYRDIFKNALKTNYRLYMHGDGIEKTAFFPCAEGNEAI